MTPARTALLLAALLVGTVSGTASASHPYGSCTRSPAETCERWAATLDDPSVTAPQRSDQFGAAAVSTSDLVIAVSKNVALNSSRPYSSTATALIRAYAKSDGRVTWTATYADRAYVNVTTATASPDGTTLFITGGAYNGFPVGATDSQLMTVAFDTADGSVRWASHWDARTDGTDNGKAIAVSPDGAEVYVSGVTTSARGDLDYVTVGYSAVDGSELWSAVYAGPKEGGSDAVFGLAVNPVQDLLYVTGWSDGVVEYDADYGTVAYALGHGTAGEGDGPGNGKGKDKPKKKPGKGSGGAAAGPTAGTVAWVARYDGLGQNRSDRGDAVTVSPDGARVFVTGDSYAGKGGGDYDYATVAYDAATGEQLWQSRYSGVGGGFNSANRIVAGAQLVLVSGQSKGAANEGNDAVTVAYDAVTGAQRWVAAVAPARSDDYAKGLQLSPDASTAYVLATSTPIVNYTALSRATLAAYSTATGALRWQSTLEGGGLNALSGSGLSVSPAGDSVSALADLKRSADPTGSPSQNIYDVVVAAFAP